MFEKRFRQTKKKGMQTTICSTPVKMNTIEKIIVFRGFQESYYCKIHKMTSLEYNPCTISNLYRGTI